MNGGRVILFVVKSIERVPRKSLFNRDRRRDRTDNSANSTENSLHNRTVGLFRSNNAADLQVRSLFAE